MVSSSMASPTKVSHRPLPCMNSTNPKAITPAESEPTSGQGLGSTRW
jgi:hypothetical protein